MEDVYTLLLSNVGFRPRLLNNSKTLLCSLFEIFKFFISYCMLDIFLLLLYSLSHLYSLFCNSSLSYSILIYIYLNIKLPFVCFFCFYSAQHDCNTFQSMSQIFHFSSINIFTYLYILIVTTFQIIIINMTQKGILSC